MLRMPLLGQADLRTLQRVLQRLVQAKQPVLGQGTWLIALHNLQSKLVLTMGMDLLRLDLLHHMVQPDQDQNPLLNLLMNKQSRLHNLDLELLLI